MHAHTIDRWRHEHVFLGGAHERNERRTRLVIALTLAMMVGEIAAGLAFGSMALLADGFHMATHAGALAIAALAYGYARRHARSQRFTFGTGKVGDLASFASAIALALVALLIGWESLQRLASPVPIRFGEAIAVACLGLAVNVASAWLLRGDEHHGHTHTRHDGHGHSHGATRVPEAAHAHHHDQLPDGGHGDLNLRAAYLHVLADALTSVLAIAGLLAGSFYGWVWMDPLMGVIGALVIARWSWGLMRDAGAVLLDTVPDAALPEAIRRTLEVGGDRVSDLHVWRLGPGHNAAVVALVAEEPQPPQHYKARLAGVSGLSHVTVEVAPCS